MWFYEVVKRTPLSFLALLLFPTTIFAASESSLGQPHQVLPRSYQEELSTRRQELQTSLEKTRQETRDRVQLRREEFVTQMVALHDRRKAEVLERLDQRLAMLNKNRTDHFSQIIVLLETILTKIGDKVGADASSEAQVAITEAQAGITSTTVLIEEQAGRDYVVTITSEATIKDDAQVVVTELQENLTALNKALQSVKEQVLSVWQLVKGASLGND